MTCVMQNLVEAKIHVQLADKEMSAFDDAPPDADKVEGTKPTVATAELGRRQSAAAVDARTHALMRLDLIAKRTAELERAARVCVDDDFELDRHHRGAGREGRQARAEEVGSDV